MLCDTIGTYVLNESIFTDVLTAIITTLTGIVAIFIAIWGSYFRLKYAGPKIKIELMNFAEETMVPERNPETNKFDDMAMYVHIKVTNKNRSYPAKNAKALVIGVQTPNESGEYKNIFRSGYLPLHWQYQFINPLYFPALPTIGHDRIFDLFRISSKTQKFVLNTHVPIPSAAYELDKKGKLKVEIVVESDESNSNIAIIELIWNGKWSNDATEMKKNVTVKMFPDEL